MATLGMIIKNFRESKSPKMSMDRFAELSNLSKSYISMLEHNKDPRGNPITPTIETINKVANAMNVPFETIFNQLDSESLVKVNSTSEPPVYSKKIPRLEIKNIDGKTVAVLEIEKHKNIKHTDAVKEYVKKIRNLLEFVSHLNNEGIENLTRFAQVMSETDEYAFKKKSND